MLHVSLHMSGMSFWIAVWGGGGSLGHTFKIHFTWDHSSEVGLASRGAQAIPAPIALKIGQESHLVSYFKTCF
jgi:hypothetical protein